MNQLRRTLGGLFRLGLAAASGGMVLASSCTAEQVKAVLAGVEVVTEQLSQDDDDVSFSDWLSDELGD